MVDKEFLVVASVILALFIMIGIWASVSFVPLNKEKWVCADADTQISDDCNIYMRKDTNDSNTN